MTIENIDPQEIEKFASFASQWWEQKGEFKTLHLINPLRVDFIDEHCGGLYQKKLLDVGCGGGILSESIAMRGGNVTGIDMSNSQIEVAKLHARESQLSINYEISSAEKYERHCDGQFDIITCMEMLEHVPEPASTIQAIYQMLKPNGSLFLSTINRTVKSYVLMIIAAERILKLLPKGTHQHSKFIKPSELLNWCDNFGFQTRQLVGVSFLPFIDICRLSRDVSVNYMVHLKKPE